MRLDPLRAAISAGEWRRRRGHALRPAEGRANAAHRTSDTHTSLSLRVVCGKPERLGHAVGVGIIPASDLIIHAIDGPTAFEVEDTFKQRSSLAVAQMPQSRVPR